MVTTCSPRPIRAVPAMLIWPSPCTAFSQAAGEASRGETGFNPTPSCVSDGIIDLGVAAMVGLQFEHLPVPVGDEAVHSCRWLRASCDRAWASHAGP